MVSADAPDPLVASPVTPVVGLDEVEPATPCVVHELAYPVQARWPQRLEELGFLPREHVTVMAYGPIGKEPLSVRVGHSTFALRRAEAACVRVRRLQP
jgi:ferrous iron transport protein A